MLIISCAEEKNSQEIDQNDIVEIKTLPVNRYNVALLVIEGTFNSELTAPMDIFHHTIFRDSIRPMNVFTISNTNDIVNSFEGLKIQPDYNFNKEYPAIDILVIPAAANNMDSDLEDEALVSFVRTAGAQAQFVISHCDGAFLLAKSGLIDTVASTTFPGDVEAYKEMYPHLDVRDNVMLVHDGKFLTSAGGAQSFEASLYLCEVLYGKKVADELAEGMVIDWDIDQFNHVRVQP